MSRNGGLRQLEQKRATPNGKGKSGISERNGVSAGCPFAPLVQYRLVFGQRHVNGRRLYFIFHYIFSGFKLSHSFNYGMCE